MARCRGEGPAAVVGDPAHPLCEMFFTAESLNSISSTCLLGWRAGRLLLGLVADRDPRRRAVLVTEGNVTYVIADLVACLEEDSRPGSWDWQELAPFASDTSPTGSTRAPAPHRAKPGPAGDSDPQGLGSGPRRAGPWGDAPWRRSSDAHGPHWNTPEAVQDFIDERGSSPWRPSSIARGPHWNTPEAVHNLINERGLFPPHAPAAMAEETQLDRAVRIGRERLPEVVAPVREFL